VVVSLHTTIPFPHQFNPPQPLEPVRLSMSVVSLMSALVLVSSLATFFAIRDYQRRRGVPYPPGPRPLPLIGNLLDIPKEFPWLTFTRLSKEHGMIYLQ
jgi:hypothetical protein